MLTEVRTSPSRTVSQIDRDDRILVCLLGSFRLLRDHRPLEGLVAGKAASLLAALALHLEDGMSREALLELLWPEQEVPQASVSLNSLVYSLHRRLRDGAGGVTAVVYASGAYSLNREGGFSTDIAQFDALVTRGGWLAAAGRAEEAGRHYRSALDLYRGDLQMGMDVYAVIERERLRASFMSILAWLADRALLHEDYLAALAYALRLIACDPCREDAHRVVMRARVRQGERAQALRQYRLCERVLHEEFDARPEALTTELFERIRVDPGSV